jgi:O-antigen ligase
MASALSRRKSMAPFYIVLFFLAMEYGRPQEFLSFLTYLHLPILSIIFLAFYGAFIQRFQWNDKQTVWCLFFLGLMVIHGPIAANNYWTLKIFIAMVINFIAYLSICNYVDSDEKYERLVSVWLVIHIFMAIIGIKNFGAGIGGFLGDENDFCMTLNMIIPFSFFLAVCSSGKKKLYYILLTCLFVFVVFLSRSRGGFVGLCVMFLYCWVRTKKKMITGFFLVLLVGFAVVFAPSTYWDRIKTIQGEGTSAGTGEERVYTWKIGWHMFLDNPVMGVGQGNFPFVFKKYEVEVMGSEDPFYGRSVAGRVAHSIYFTLLPELGLIGLFIFSGIVYYNLKDLKAIKSLTDNKKPVNKSHKIEDKFYFMAVALEGSLISYLVSGIFISILYYPNFWISMGFIISLRKIVLSKVNNLQLKPSN